MTRARGHNGDVPHRHGLQPGHHGHTHGVVDPSIAATSRGIWAITWSFGALTVTALLQLAVVLLSGSVALLADTIHNFGDAATAAPPCWSASPHTTAPSRPPQTGEGRPSANGFARRLPAATRRCSTPRASAVSCSPVMRAIKRPEGLREPELERAIGVIYRPETERASHYFYARLPDQFDAALHFDETRAVEPLERTAEWEAGEVPETFPFGV